MEALVGHAAALVQQLQPRKDGTVVNQTASQRHDRGPEEGAACHSGNKDDLELMYLAYEQFDEFMRIAFCLASTFSSLTGSTGQQMCSLSVAVGGCTVTWRLSAPTSLERQTGQTTGTTNLTYTLNEHLLCGDDCRSEFLSPD